MKKLILSDEEFEQLLTELQSLESYHWNDDRYHANDCGSKVVSTIEEKVKDTTFLDAAVQCLQEFETMEPYFEIIDGVAEEFDVAPLSLAFEIMKQEKMSKEMYAEYKAYLEATPSPYWYVLLTPDEQVFSQNFDEIPVIFQEMVMNPYCVGTNIGRVEGKGWAMYSQDDIIWGGGTNKEALDKFIARSVEHQDWDINEIAKSI